MEETNLLQTYTARVNKYFLVLFFLATLTSFSFSALSMLSSYFSCVVMFLGVGASAVLIYKKRFEKTIMYILMISAFLGLSSTMIDVCNMAAGNTVTDLTNSVIVLAMVGLNFSALYLVQWVPIAFCIGLNAVLLYIYLTINTFSLYEFLIGVICLTFSGVILFFLTKWGSGLINTAESRHQEAASVLAELENTMGVIKSSTYSLNKDIANCNNNLQIVHEISDTVSTAIQEIAKGVVGQTESVTKINIKMNEADRKISEVNDFSKQLAMVSTKASEVVEEGSGNIQEMDKQMEIINQAVTKSSATVQELNKSMDEVNTFLYGITQIAEQTNLLALNAAIEAARAGDLGKGFAVVAEEIRKLAEQSSDTVKQINQIVNQIKSTTQDVLYDVQKGNEATQVGDTIVSEVNKSFERIHSAFTNINGLISEETAKIDNTVALFFEMREETESIASISEEHAASTEELTATTEEHNANIESIYKLVRNIQKSAEDLQAIIK